ncbi:tetratricopeptide repeat protein [Massilia sp. W12]|uniref:tetratricopeptide repeat protein n=1 Tax=Massilia sp. W12 TaxID=3126507 RepID=UPI0030D0AA29
MRKGLIISGVLIWLSAGAQAWGQERRAEYIPLLKAAKLEDAWQKAQTALAQDGCKAEALLVKSELLLERSGDNLDEHLTQAEKCAAQDSKNSMRQETLGLAYGAKAMSGMMAGMRYAGKSRDALSHALELDPKNMGARKALFMYYLMAPGIAGGSHEKARILADDCQKVDPAGAAMLHTLLLMEEKKPYDKAFSQIMAQPGADYEHQILQLMVFNSAGQTLLEQKKFSDAEAVFKRAAEFYPEHEFGNYGLGRVRQEQGQFAQALPFFEKAGQLNPRNARVWMRTGQTLQALGGQSQRAIAAFEKALALKPGLNKKMREQAQEALRSLKG